jgi:hypothetical protein
LLLPKAGWHDHLRFWTCEREEEGKVGMKIKVEERNSLRCVGGTGVVHQEEFWFW